jgi:glutamate formiminotransferase/formiminotetrahydrofolate cyclodeaminase
MTSKPTPLLGETVSAFLDRLADRTPTPGGGAVAALAGALAASMARMVGAYSSGRQSSPEQPQPVTALCDELAIADRMLRRLVQEDAAAYEQVAQALRAAREPSEEANRRLHEAIAIAMAVPMEIAAIAASTLNVIQRLLPMASPYLLSDVGVAAVAADACIKAAAYSVRVNAAELTDESERTTVHTQLADIMRRASATRAAIELALPDAIRPPTA